MLLEIGSFNALFVEAKNKKIVLKSFTQDETGFFFCQWRVRDGEIGPELKRRAPFTAALDSFLALRDKVETPAPEPQDVLFG